MRVAVTGASGFVGGYVARSLAERGHRIVGFGRRPAAALPFPMPDYHQWDLATGPLRIPGIDALVHCAAQVGDWGDERGYQRSNVVGTQAVLDSFPGARVVHVSSSSVYSDDVSAADVREDAATGKCAHSAYARTKAEAERLVLACSPGAVVLRPHIVYGPGDTTLLPRLLASRRLGHLCIPGTGSNHLSVTHVGNLAIAVAAALDTPDACGFFNIADAEPITVDALLRTVLERTGSRTHLVYLPAGLARVVATLCETVWRLGALRGSPPLTHYVVDQLTREHTLNISRARQQLGYCPQWSIHDGPLDAGDHAPGPRPLTFAQMPTQ